MAHIEGVLFDVDGTLVDTTFIHTVCWWQAFRQADLDAQMAVIHRSIGMGGPRLIDNALGERASGVDTDALSAAHDALYSAYWPQLRVLPGARDLLLRTKRAGLKVILASSAKQSDLDVLLGVLDVGDAIDVVTSSSDAEDSKPAPDIIEVALTKAKLPAERTAFVGDAVWDVHAAAAAGVACIGLESGGTSAAELTEAGAVATYRDPAHLLEHFDGSLLGR
ncbi:HAD family hydrolase [Jatrophihabitans telluris]|uniref:HAD family hydrolase n=1 Tax=Jatrophihabitans telluris TaxID=2038343 RepID=A0ABY4QVQ4_9ACTN|nr:HAD family hydrolase [Jatrophihabitans telluris]UQX87580.1 HAD family hydrolase [Jatrophihabitans telluris]